MLQETSKKIDMYDVELSNVDGKFNIRAEVNGVNKEVLLTLPNPHYARENQHLHGIKMPDTDGKELLPNHAILGANDVALIKTSKDREFRPTSGGEDKVRLGYHVTWSGEPIINPDADKEFNKRLYAVMRYNRTAFHTFEAMHPDCVRELRHGIYVDDIRKRQSSGKMKPSKYSRKEAKMNFKDICERKISWDETLPDDLQKCWKNCTKKFPKEFKITRSIALRKNEISGVEFHGFPDASTEGCSAIVNVVDRQGSFLNQ
eukprot:gene6737-12300_t